MNVGAIVGPIVAVVVVAVLVAGFMVHRRRQRAFKSFMDKHSPSSCDGLGMLTLAVGREGGGCVYQAGSMFGSGPSG